jgi:hypothetical protein
MISMEIKAGLYQHKSGRFYQVLGIGAHCKTEELFVVAVALSMQPGTRMRLRPLSEWEEEVEWPDGTKGPRFKYVGTGLQFDVQR